MRARRATVVAATVAAGLLFTAGCGQGDGADVEAAVPVGFAPTKEYLASVVDDTADQTFRYEIEIDVHELGDMAVTGAQDGERMQMVMDFASLAGEEDLPRGLDADDFFVETVADAETMYMRAPFYEALLGELARAGDRLPAGMLELARGLARGWVSADLAALGEVSPGQASSAVGGAGMDPQLFLDAVREADSVHELGSDVVRDTPVTGLGAELTMAEWLGTHGDVGQLDPRLAEIVVPVEVWLDADGLIRRVGMELDMPAGTASPDQREDVQISYTFDFFDYGDDSIEIELPSDATDVTGALVTMLEAMSDVTSKVPGVGGGSSALPTPAVDLPEMPDAPELPEVEVPPELVDPEIPEIPPYEPPDLPELPPPPEIPPDIMTPPTIPPDLTTLPPDPCTTTDVC